MILKRKTNEQFLLEIKANHPTLRPLEEYVNNRTKIEMVCLMCGYKFNVTPASLYMKHGCPKCTGRYKSQEDFEKELFEKSPNIKPLDKYNGSKNKIDVECNICQHIWSVTPNSLLSGKGCPKCSGLMKKTQEEFISQMKHKHPNILVIGKYKNNREKVKCHCNICNADFFGIPHAMLDGGNGCPICSISKGERAIRNWLVLNNIEFISEHTFKDCKDINVLPFDFYIPSQNVVIEYDGKQHYEPNPYFGGDKGFLYTKNHDSIKNNYCKNRGIKIIRIPYWEFKNIHNILNTELMK